jgi:hypothetical protein
MEEKTLIKGTFPESYGWLGCLGFLGAIILFVGIILTSSYPRSDYVFIFPIIMVLGLVLLIMAIVWYRKVSQCSLTITDKRVYGTAEFGRRVDLPLDKVSSVGVGPMKSISIATSSGVINFFFCTNKEKVFDTVSSLLIARQQNPQTVSVHNGADELKKYKDLLDDGVISQEEFEAKKKQLLDL